jgi:hypothetical protein
MMEGAVFVAPPQWQILVLRNYVLSIQFGVAFGLRHNWCELKLLIDPISAFLQSSQFIPFPSTIHLRLP